MRSENFNDGDLNRDDLRGELRGELHGDGAHGTDATLSPADCEALDLLIAHEFDLNAAISANPAASARLHAAHALFTRLDAYECEAPDESIVDATLAHIARADDATAARMRFDPALDQAQSTGPSRGRWHDFIGLACAAILILSIGIPIASYMQGRNADAECGNNQRNLASGIASYVRDNEHMPIAAGFSPDFSALTSWNDYKSAKHLNELVDGGYCSKGCLACGNDATNEGYAYQVPSRGAHFAWSNGSRAPAIADRNPVIDLSRRGQVVGVLVINSPEHDGRGQNVLFTDGSVEFLGSPMLIVPSSAAMKSHLENIWIPMDQGHLEDGIDSPGEWLGLDIFLTQ